jgi:hypothetical protein
MPAHDPQGFVLVPRFEDQDAAEHLSGFCEGPVGQRRLAAFPAHGRRLCGILQGKAGGKVPLGVQLLVEGRALGDERLLLRRAQLSPDLLVETSQTDESHGFLSAPLMIMCLMSLAA